MSVDVVKSVDDGAVKLSSSAGVRALTHHIRDATLWAADDNGDFYEMLPGAGSLTLVGATGAGLCYSMQRDGDEQQTIYLAGSGGLYASFDMGRTWRQVRDYSGAGLDGLAVGYGALVVQAVAPMTLYSLPTGTDPNVKAKSLWNGSSNDPPPTGWRDIGYDDSGWAAAIEANHTGNPLTDAAAKALWTTLAPVSNTEQMVIRQTFTLGAGRVNTATLTIRADDTATVWLNGAYLSGAVVFASASTISVDPSSFRVGANTLEVLAANGAPAQAWIAWKLEIT